MPIVSSKELETGLIIQQSGVHQKPRKQKVRASHLEKPSPDAPRAILGGIIRDKLRELDLSQIAFAEVTGIGQSTIAEIIGGTVLLPQTRIEEWAGYLALTGKARRQFLDLAFLCHAPEIVQQRLLSHERRIAALERELAEIIGDQSSGESPSSSPQGA